MIELIGWIGSGAILLAYALVSLGKVSSKSKAYQLLNLIGAVGIIVNSGFHQAYPSVGLNIIWLGIAVYGLVMVTK